ncbi:DUF4328 domain-containing protein [Actinokineospora sp. PR83]|uniref:DUF4328 domain-containing protein n=1 Tax=Actinokineospora sp. PR83 TaxID=2884908 RepID=UPI001F36A443|nr:DUF4328 domain-containing protein [Actinokineospora sp. PR83]MCG8915424.1 DUF4328 domain-containing protein [Actinokineospora sp. PR83]
MTEMTGVARTDDHAPAAPPDDVPIVRPAHTARCTASALIAVTALVACSAAWQAWGSYALVRDPAAEAAQLVAANARAVTLAWVWLAGSVASTAAFAAWLWQARANSARICAAPHRLGPGWVVGAWFAPGLNLWLPAVVVSDVWRASNPDVPPRGADLRAVPTGWVVGLWWGASLLALVAEAVGVVLAGGHTVAAFGAVYAAAAVGAGLTVVAAAAVLYLMRRVDRWQTGREAVTA